MQGLLSQVRIRDKTTILMATATTGQSFYVKCAAAPLNDAAVAQTLSTAAPEQVMKPLKVDLEGRKMICFDYGEILEGDRVPNGGVVKVVLDLARLKKASKNFLNELEAAGLPVLTAQRMEDQLDEVLFSKEFDVLGMEDVLKEVRSPETRAKIVADLRELGEVESKVGISFVHWDWQGDNVHRG